ncbi:Translation inhibition and nonsense-mediated decay [Polyrhizophydium stewartii]|uniref:Translation inhibition and nonsense-mediated decay n=1 Tax=Polyrhizophydium stewartii TaxID=2732419 RepID=A0ABR4N8N9_9FUNG
MPSLPDDIVNAQAQLVKSLRSGGPLSQQTDALYRRLCKLLEDFAFASGDIIKAEDYMWRYLHLRVIEVFRAGIEKPPHDGNNDQGDPHRSKRADGDSARALQAGFRVFLNNSIGFYLEFIRKLHAREPLAAVQRAVMADIASCMEFSDLHGARYKDTLSGRTLREARCLLSKRFYNMAVRLIPDNGHPFNQLSVIASKYEMDLLRAFELYFRSLAISIPYRIALENIHTTCVEAQTRVKAKVASPEVPPFASVFKAHIGALLWKVSSPEAIAAESQSVISGIEAFLSDPALRKRLNISPDDIKSILVVSLGAVFLSESPETFSQRSNKHHSTASGTGGGKHGKRTDLAPHDPSVVLDFTWNLVRVVLKYVLALARSQISKGVVWSGSDSGQSSDELDFFEPLLPHVKLALKFLSNRVKQGMYLGSLTPDYWPLVAKWDASIPLGEMAPIRIAQILEIANELCATMPPRLFFSMFQSADKRYRMFSTVPPENPSIAFTSVTARGGLLPAGIWGAPTLVAPPVGMRRTSTGMSALSGPPLVQEAFAFGPLASMQPPQGIESLAANSEAPQNQLDDDRAGASDCVDTISWLGLMDDDGEPHARPATTPKTPQRLGAGPEPEFGNTAILADGYAVAMLRSASNATGRGPGDSAAGAGATSPFDIGFQLVIPRTPTSAAKASPTPVTATAAAAADISAAEVGRLMLADQDAAMAQHAFRQPRLLHQAQPLADPQDPFAVSWWDSQESRLFPFRTPARQSSFARRPDDRVPGLREAAAVSSTKGVGSSDPSAASELTDQHASHSNQ